MCYTNCKYISIEHLRTGTKKQNDAYEALKNLKALNILRDFSPLVVGTIPIDVDIENSDIDIICEANDLGYFMEYLNKHFSSHSNFTSWSGKRKKNYAVAKFEYSRFIFEIFGEPTPTIEQNAYLHMIAEAKLLAIGGEAAQKEIRILKQSGLKTEPAFGQYFKLNGNPYETLLDLAKLPTDQIMLKLTS